MTRQVHDAIEYNGKTFYFYSHIFSKYLQSIDKDIKFRMVSTANYSGTYESYVIQDGKLYLKHFFGFIEGDLPRKNFLDPESEFKDYNIDKSYFFSEEKIIDDLIFADWFCGVIEIQEDPFPPYGESYFIIFDYGEIIEMHKFHGRIIEGVNHNAPIYNYPRFEEPSENDDDLYKYEYSIISKLSDFDYILEDKSKEDLLLLGRFFDYYKKSLEGKSYHEKRDIFANELEKLKEI